MGRGGEGAGRVVGWVGRRWGYMERGEGRVKGRLGNGKGEGDFDGASTQEGTGDC